MPSFNQGRAAAIARPAGVRSVASAAVEREALVVTNWFDSGADGEPYSATIRLRGQRVGIRGRPGPRDSFIREDTVNEIVPGSGPVSVSTWVYGLEPGEWIVTGELIRPGGAAANSVGAPGSPGTDSGGCPGELAGPGQYRDRRRPHHPGGDPGSRERPGRPDPARVSARGRPRPGRGEPVVCGPPPGTMAEGDPGWLGGGWLPRGRPGGRDRDISRVRAASGLGARRHGTGPVLRRGDRSCWMLPDRMLRWPLHQLALGRVVIRSADRCASDPGSAGGIGCRSRHRRRRRRVGPRRRAVDGRGRLRRGVRRLPSRPPAAPSPASGAP